MKIGITKAESDSKFNIYLNWLKAFNVDFEILDHENSGEVENSTDNLSGIIFSGGIDVYPELYCDWDTKERKGTYSPERDGYELRLLEIAFKRKLPVLCICRGLQIVNVYFRGSLIFDIEEMRNVSHRKISKTEDRYHDITVFRDTLLFDIMKTDKCQVNSSHHQSIDRLGEGLMINAKSDDGIVEGIEFADKSEKSFFIGVQWHPERFANVNEPASGNILNTFINECSNFKNKC